MASLEELDAAEEKRVPVKPAEVVEEELFLDEDDILKQDLLDASTLLSRCMHLMFYISDKEACKNVTKRERDSLAHIAEQVKEFLDAIESMEGV